MSNFKFKGGKKQPPPGVGMGMGNPQQQPVARIPIETLDDIICTECDHNLFISLMVIKHMPQIYSPNNQEGTVNAPAGVLCVNCGAIGKVKRQKAQVKDPNLQDGKADEPENKE